MEILSREFLPQKRLSVHASSICFHPNGHPVFAWFEGTREGAQDVFIRVFNLNGDKKSILIGDLDGMPRWNPVLFSHNNKVYLFEKIGAYCDRWQTLFHDITKWDENTTKKEIFDEAQFLPAGLNGCVKNKPLISNNIIYCGSSTETVFDWASYIEAYEIKDSRLYPLFKTNPLTTEKVSYISPFGGAKCQSLGLIQPAIWEDGDCLCAVFRASYGLGKIYYSKTKKENHSKWDKPTPIDIDNPNSSVDVVKYHDRLFMACNPVKNSRNPLVVFEMDKNLSVIDHIVVQEEIKEHTLSGECSYPSMIEKNGELHLTYTWGRSRIEYVAIKI